MVSGDDVRDKLILQPLKLIFNGQLFLFHALNLQNIAARLNHCRNRCIKIRMVLFQSRKCEADFGLFLFDHCLPMVDTGPGPGWLGIAPDRNQVSLGRLSQIYQKENPTRDYSTIKRTHVTLSSSRHMRFATGGLVSFKPNKGELSMSIESHLSQLQKKHHALETELANAVQHPSVDDLEIAELKRRKLVLKDEIEKLRTTH